MNKKALKKHLEDTSKILVDMLAEKNIEVEKLKDEVTIDNIGELVSAQIDAIKLEEKIKEIADELDGFEE